MNAIAQTVRAQLARSGSANIANCLLKRGLRWRCRRDMWEARRPWR